MRNNLKFIFEKLKEIITEGYISIGDYIYLGYKSFRIKRILNIHRELETILKLFRLKRDFFHILDKTVCLGMTIKNLRQI